RQTDITGIFGLTNNFQNTGCSVGGTVCVPVLPTLFPTALGQHLFNEDIADETAAKIGALYKFESTGTTVGGIVEYMKRWVPGDLAFQNERTRWGTWAFLSQQVTPKDTVHFGWAHAFPTPGDPGQHNDTTLLGDCESGTCFATFATNHNQADMVTAAWKHQFS